jgi:hypothetical protein
MIGKLARGFGMLFVYLCVATILTEAIGLGFLAFRGRLTGENVHQVLAIAQGVDLQSQRQAAEEERRKTPAEQTSPQDIAQALAVKMRNLELRELGVQNALSRVRAEQEKLTGEKDQYVLAKTKFDQSLKATRDAALGAGMEEVRTTLEAVKPKQAKEQIVKMLDANEMTEVVRLFSAMTAAKRAKIIAEFKTEEEAKKLSEILRLIRQGSEEATLSDKTQQQLQPVNANTAGP